MNLEKANGSLEFHVYRVFLILIETNLELEFLNVGAEGILYKILLLYNLQDVNRRVSIVYFKSHGILN